jgi:hypothetical protein
MVMYWLRNPNQVVLDLSFTRDARNEPLVWAGAGTTGSRRCLTAANLDQPHVARLVYSGAVVPDPAYDVEHTGRSADIVRELYTKAFAGRVAGAVSVPVAAPVAAPVAVPVAAVPAPVEPPAEVVAEVVAAPVEEPLEEPLEEPVAEPLAEPIAEPIAEAPAAPSFEMRSGKKRR